tara:strand:- start:18232 stop:18477 length:246 start_codon:yes stop_codon:yes gene_type:complete
MRRTNRELGLHILKDIEKTIDTLLKRSDSADLYKIGAKTLEDEAYYKGESEAYLQARNMVAKIFVDLDDSITELFEYTRDY